jgi:hypothetical protein
MRLSQFQNVLGDTLVRPADPSDPHRAKAIHNERTKLNASFYNRLAVWFEGAGSVVFVLRRIVLRALYDKRMLLRIGDRQGLRSRLTRRPSTTAPNL